MDDAIGVERELYKSKDSVKSQVLARFFKTGKGEYGEGDIFLGVVVPKQRMIAKDFANIPLSEIKKLLKNRIHECRLTALFILVNRYRKSDNSGKRKIALFYLANTKFINNWDLVDLSAPNIIGSYLSDKDNSDLYKLAVSKNLWERRIAILSTLTFIRANKFDDTLALAELLLTDKHDLIHKAVGWMLREVGKRDQSQLEGFLKLHYQDMPRTMLRYAIEKFSPRKRQVYLTRVS
jgi:3-methyladenine DNA glycosylase AlkD